MDVAAVPDDRKRSGGGDRNSSRKTGSWDTESVFDSARYYFDSMLEGIDRARESIELVVYIFELDETGSAFKQRLQAAAQRGVAVRILVDGVGSARSADLLAEQLTAYGAEFHIFRPLPWYWNSYRWSLRRGSWLQKFWYFFNSANRRDHRKFMVVDGKRAWCGNLNLCDDHLEGHQPPWRDYGVCVEGRAIRSLRTNFDQVWREVEGRVGLGDFQLCLSNVSLRMRWVRNRWTAASIRRARQRVWVCAAYFAPSGPIIRALRAARKKNIDVRLIVAGRSDVTLFPLLTSTYYADLLKMGVRIYQYERGVLHAKVLLVDGECVIGSSNFNHRSFYHDLELDIVLSRPESLRQMESWLQRDMEASHVVDGKDVSLLSRSFWLGWLPRLIRYWM